MKDYRKKAVTGYNICYRQYLKTAVSILLIEAKQTAADTQQQKYAAEMEEECQKNGLKKRRQQEMSY